MSYFNMNRRAYADRKAPDGVIASGWRYVKKGGMVKIGGTYYHNKKLETIVGEYVKVSMDDYWQQDVQINRGLIGCSRWYCDAKAIDKPKS